MYLQQYYIFFSHYILLQGPMKLLTCLFDPKQTTPLLVVLTRAGVFICMGIYIMATILQNIRSLVYTICSALDIDQQQTNVNVRSGIEVGVLSACIRREGEENIRHDITYH